MLDEFIMKQLEENDSRLEKLNAKLKNLYREEESCSHMIKKLQETEDVGLELFSPRGSSDTTRKRVAEIKNQIQAIQLEQIQVGEQIDRAKQEEERYQKMLVEARNKNVSKLTSQKHTPSLQTEEHAAAAAETISSVPDSRNPETVCQHKEELKAILSRVDKCISLFGTDRGQCKHELTNLKYYLKALISKK